MGHNQDDAAKTARLAYNWLLGAGVVAVLFSMFLVCADRYLSTSRGEIDKAARIQEMRRAQASFESLRVDDRMLRAVQVNESAESHGHSGNH